MTKQSFYKSFLPLLILMAGGAGTAHALPTFCVAESYADFIAATNDGPGAGCNIGGVEYFGAQLVTQAAGDTPPTTPATAQQLQMSFSDQGFGVSGIPEVDSGTDTYFFGFNIDPAPVLTGDTISLDPPIGLVTLNAFVCQPDTPYVTFNSGAFYCSTQPHFGDGTDIAFAGDQIPIAQIQNDGTDNQSTFFNFPGAPVSQAGIILELILDSDGPASVGTIGTDPATIDLTPEPGSWMLIATGLAFLMYRFTKRGELKTSTASRKH